MNPIDDVKINVNINESGNDFYVIGPDATEMIGEDYLLWIVALWNKTIHAIETASHDKEDFLPLSFRTMKFLSGLSYSQQAECEKFWRQQAFLDVRIVRNPSANRYRIHYKKLAMLLVKANDGYPGSHLTAISPEILAGLHPQMENNRFLRLFINLLINNINIKYNSNYKLNNIMLNNKLNNIVKYNKTYRYLILSKANIKLKKVKGKSFKTHRKLASPTRQEAEHIFCYWNLLGHPLPRHRKSKSKTYPKSIANLEKTLMEYEPEEIKFAIATFRALLIDSSDARSKLTLDPTFAGHRERLPEFLFPKQFNVRIVKNHPGTSHFTKSWFHECKRGKDPFFKFSDPEISEDVYLPIMKELEGCFTRKFRKGRDPIYDAHERRCFRKAANLFTNFYKTNENNLFFSPHYSGIESYVFVLLETIDEERKRMNKKKAEITPGWLAAKWLYEAHFPIYLRKKDLLDDNRDNKYTESNFKKGESKSWDDYEFIGMTDEEIEKDVEAEVKFMIRDANPIYERMTAEEKEEWVAEITESCRKTIREEEKIEKEYGLYAYDSNFDPLAHL